MLHLPYRAIVVDFDRTLLRTDKSISDYTKKVLREWQENGARLLAATARPERAVTEYCRILGLDGVTTLNGARTILPDAVYENVIAGSDATLILRELNELEGIVLSAETGNGLFANTEIPEWQPAVTGDICALPDKEKIYKILASHPDIPAEKIRLNLPEGTYATIADEKLVQIMAAAATKWNGVRQMLDAYGIPASQAVYFGDDNDDIEPLKKCGCGVAVRNALQSVREAADYVVKSNDEDGVAAFLDQNKAYYERLQQ